MIKLRSLLRAYLACGLYVMCRPFMRHHRGKTRVLVFHHIDSEKHFSKIVRALARRYHIISFDDYLKGKKSNTQINVIIALDDGYRSWFTKGRPVFNAFLVKPLLFISSDFIGLDEDTAKRFCQTNIHTWPEAALMWPDLDMLVKEGAEIGGHSLGHTNLMTADTDIAADRQEIEKRLSIKVRSFSYPFGLYDASIAQRVQQAGYAYAFTSDSGFLEDSQNNFLLKRTNVGQRPPLVVEAFVEGWADFVSLVIKRIKGL